MNSNISIVIPSVGGDILLKTISLLNRGSIVPKEIIIVVPNVYAHRIPEITLPNLHFEIVDFKGQVEQRAHGFKMAKYDFVMQLDDDIQLDTKCIEKLLRALKSLGQGHSVGPSFFFEDTSSTVYSMGVGMLELLTNIKAYLLSGALWGSKRMGTIGKNGVGFGYDFNRTIYEHNSTEWLAGGCILHYRSGLILENYFPFEGKAYGEDLIHSFLLMKLGIKLYHVKSAICYIERPDLNTENYSLYSDFKSRAYLNELKGIGKTRIYFWYGARIINKYIKILVSRD